MATGSSFLSISHALPGEHLPGSVLTNERLTGLMEEVGWRMRRAGRTEEVPVSTPEFPEQRVGVRERRVLDDGLGSFDLAVEAGRRCLDRASGASRHVRAVIVSTVTPDRVVPSLACRLQDALDLDRACGALDVSLGCNGFLGAIDLADRLLAGFPEGSCILVVSTEAMTRVLDASDRATCPIFGDGAGAVLLQRGGNGGMSRVANYTDGSKAELIQITAGALPSDRPMFRLASRRGDLAVREDCSSRARVVMDGRRVFRDMVRVLPAQVKSYLADRELTVDDVDHFAFHQANRRLIEAAVELGGLDIPPHKLLFNIEAVGNTTSASIPILLSQAAAAGTIEPGQRVMLIGFGTGYSLGLTVLEWSRLA